MDAKDLLPMGEITRRSGFAASAIRYYEAEGLIEAHRSGGGQRRFERNVLRRLAFIRAASNVGLTIEEIREELGRLPGNRTPTKADWQRISRHWGRRLDEQIAALQRLKSGLDGCIGCGCLSLRSCAFSNPDDVHGERGAGARLLPDSLRRPHPDGDDAGRDRRARRTEPDRLPLVGPQLVREDQDGGLARLHPRIRERGGDARAPPGEAAGQRHPRARDAGAEDGRPP